MNQPETTTGTKKGDIGFAGIVEQCQGMVYNTALSIVQNEADAEDITQEVFIDVYESLDDFREEAQLSTWIYRITVNKALDFEKKKKTPQTWRFIKTDLFSERGGGTGKL